MVAFAAVAVVFVAPPRVQAQAVAKSYTTEGSLQPGMFVRLDTNDKTKVLSVGQDEAGKTFGVVVQPNDAPISLSGDDSTQRAYVATTGSYQVLVSDQNGTVKKGDYLVISALEGIAMKADQDQQYAVAKSLGDFTADGASAGQTTLKDSKGVEHVVHFGYVSADINVARNPLLKTTTDDLPPFLRSVADSVTSKQVSPLRVYLGAVVVVVTALIVIAVLYAGIRTSVVSLGRNPLARSAIMRNLLQVVLTAIIVLIIGLFAVYLLLKL